MIEKVNPSHPDKLADRIAGALVDLAHKKDNIPKAAFEVLIGHGKVYVIGETSVHISVDEVYAIVKRIAGNLKVDYTEVPQDPELATNQKEKIRAGDNGIFKGVPVKSYINELSSLSRNIYSQFPTDGKYILADNRLIVCQSYASEKVLTNYIKSLGDYELIVNPLGYWTGGVEADSGATNRKLGSDMGEAVTGGGLHGKDLSKADVSVNIYAHLKAQTTGKIVNIHCAIGDEFVDGRPYSDIVEIARGYIDEIGGFEKLAEWGIV